MEAWMNQLARMHKVPRYGGETPFQLYFRLRESFSGLEDGSCAGLIQLAEM